MVAQLLASGFCHIPEFGTFIMDRKMRGVSENVIVQFVPCTELWRLLNMKDFKNETT